MYKNISIYIYFYIIRPDATRRNHFSTCFHFLFKVFINILKNTKIFESVCFPPEGNFYMDAGDGDEGGGTI